MDTNSHSSNQWSLNMAEYQKPFSCLLKIETPEILVWWGLDGAKESIFLPYT